MDTAEILRQKAAEIEKLWSDIGKIVDTDSWAGDAYREHDVYDLVKAIDKGQF